MADRNVIVRDCKGRKPVIDFIAKTASTLFDKNSLVEYVSGVINPSDSTDVVVLGIILQEVTAADSDYATSGAQKQVQILQGGEEVEIAYTGSAPTPGVSYGIGTAYSVDQTNTTQKVCTCVRVTDTTAKRAIFTFLTYSGGTAI